MQTKYRIIQNDSSEALHMPPKSWILYHVTIMLELFWGNVMDIMHGLHTIIIEYRSDKNLVVNNNEYAGAINR